jgi:leader peptidase (prepilin peptidase)/N-methyltransferase
MIWQGYLLTGVFGLIIGSFLNVLIYRIPRHKNVVFDRSACPTCGRLIAWYHNIPMLSYLLLLGKCASCRKPISLRYPIVETANAALYLFFVWQFGLSFEFAVFSALGSTLLVIFLIDLDFQIIPDVITLPGMIAGLAVSFLPEGIGIISALIGLVVGGGALYLIAMAGDILFKKESMGGGDIKMAAMLGAFLGWKKVLLVFMLSPPPDNPFWTLPVHSRCRGASVWRPDYSFLRQFISDAAIGRQREDRRPHGQRDPQAESPV